MRRRPKRVNQTRPAEPQVRLEQDRVRQAFLRTIAQTAPEVLEDLRQSCGPWLNVRVAAWDDLTAPDVLDDLRQRAGPHLDPTDAAYDLGPREVYQALTAWQTRWRLEASWLRESAALTLWDYGQRLTATGGSWDTTPLTGWFVGLTPPAAYGTVLFTLPLRSPAAPDSVTLQAVNALYETEEAALARILGPEIQAIRRALQQSEQTLARRGMGPHGIKSRYVVEKGFPKDSRRRHSGIAAGIWRGYATRTPRVSPWRSAWQGIRVGNGGRSRWWPGRGR